MIEQAYISGQAGKALYEKDGSFFIAGLEDFSNPAACRPGDLSLYIESGADFVPLKDKELDLDKIKASLKTKRNASRALTLSISGFNKELTDSTRSLCIEAAEELLQDEAALFFAKSRLLARPLPESHDIAGAIKFAENFPAPVICSLYKEIVDSQQFIKHLSAAWSKTAPDFFTLEPERQKVEKQLIDLGLFADMASFMAKGDFKNLGYISSSRIAMIPPE